MQIEKITQENYITLVPEGDLDANSSIKMDESITEILSNGYRNLHIDCSKLNYISSAGLGVFISFMEEIRSGGGKFIFSGMSENVHKVFELLGLHQVLAIVGTAEEAANSFDQ